MSYVLDTTHSKKNIAVYSENRETDTDYFLSLEGKWRKILKNGKSGWLVPVEFKKKLEKFVKSKAPSAPSSSPLTTIKQNGKNRKTQEKYRRAVSEDEGAEEDKKAPPPTENQATDGAEEEAEEAEAEADAEIEVSEVKIKGKTYFTTDAVNGIIYACVDDDVGDEVGVFKNGVAVFNKSKK